MSLKAFTAENAVNAEQKLNGLTEVIIASAMDVHRQLGPGLLESTYEVCLAHELVSRGVQFERQLALPVSYKGLQIESGYRVDLLVEKAVIVELKSVAFIEPVHSAQLLTYLKLSRLQFGLLINFNVKLLKQGLRRFVNALPT